MRVKLIKTKRNGSLYLSLISTILLISNCNGHCQQKNNPPLKNQEQHSNNINKPLLSKDLYILSQFTDTLILKRYKPEIDQFAKDDSLHTGRKIDILFTGSSSIRKWHTLQSDMNGYQILNRGFGGSTIPEVIYYSDILIFKHHPSKIVFYAGENDIACITGDTFKVAESFKYLQRLINQNLPETHLYFVSLKPSPARWKYWPQMQCINKRIKEYCQSVPNCTYIDISKDMFDENNLIRQDLFKPDRLHLNQTGYKIWSSAILGSIKTENK